MTEIFRFQQTKRTGDKLSHCSNIDICESEMKIRQTKTLWFLNHSFGWTSVTWMLIH